MDDISKKMQSRRECISLHSQARAFCRLCKYLGDLFEQAEEERLSVIDLLHTKRDVRKMQPYAIRRYLGLARVLAALSNARI